MDKAVILTYIQVFEERKSAGDYDYILARRGETLLRILANSSLSQSQIECATKEELNKTIVEEIILAFAA